MKTSSCAGRIVLLIAPALFFFPREKYGNKVTPLKIKPCFNKQPVTAIWSDFEGNEEISFL